MRIIFHIDMNAFYANCEISQHPELKGNLLSLVIILKEVLSLLLLMKQENLVFIPQCLYLWQKRNVLI